jgi:hypothetical protein
VPLPPAAPVCLYLALLVLVTLAPTMARADDGAEDGTAAATLVGLVVRGPMCPPSPLNRPGDCDDVPFAAELVVLTTDRSTEVARVTTDDGGAFSVALDPGTYLLEPLTPVGQLYPRAASRVVDIDPDRPTSIVVRYDTGIR